MRLSLIVAMAKNRVIGANGQIPWHLAEDLKNFKTITMGCAVLMGRKTFQSIGRPLPGRQNIVITRDNTFSAAGIQSFKHIEPALKEMDKLAQQNNVNESFIIGGAEIYKLTLNLAGRLYISEVNLEPEGDTWFPEIDFTDWKEVTQKFYKSNDYNIPDFVFKIFDRVV